MNTTFKVELSKAIKLADVETISELLKVFYDNDRYEIKYIEDGICKYTAIPFVYEYCCERYFDKLELDDVSILLRLVETTGIKYGIINETTN